MLPPWIIEQLRERERSRKDQRSQPQLEIDAPEHEPLRRSEPPDGPGVLIIPVWGDAD